jgi:glutathione synthase/RimK-type ligase-like ATP-grasp enzyme
VTRLVAVYDAGSVRTAEIAAGLRRLGDVTFAVPAAAATPALLTVMGELGGVVTLDGDLAGQVRALAARSPDAIVTFSERVLRHTAALADGLGLPFHSIATAELLTDKLRQRERLREAGVDGVRSRSVARPDELPAALEAVGLPAIVKPRRSEGSRNTYLVTDPEQAAELVGSLLAAGEREMVVEEYLRGRDCAPFGDYVSVESLVADGEVTHVSVTGKLPLVPPFREIGHCWPAALPEPERRAVEDLAAAALRALGVRVGVTHTEIKLTADGPRVIEVNGRLGGLVNELSVPGARLDLVETAGRLALGGGVPAFSLRDDAVCYLHHNPAPTVPCSLASVEGARQVRALPGVRSYRVLVRPGSPIEGGVHTSLLDLLIGQAPDHAAMLATIDAELDALAFTFQLPGGPVRVAARSLRRCWEDSTP